MRDIWNRINLGGFDFTGALCANPAYDPEWWTIESSRSYSRASRSNHKIAKDICTACPIRVRCLETALINPTLRGIWGGTNDSERAKIRALRKRKDQTNSPAYERG